MSKQDSQGARTVADLERKYNFGKTFAEVYKLASDAQTVAEDAKKQFEGLNQDQIFNLLTNYGEWQGIYRDDKGKIYINGEYVNADKLKVNAANIEGRLIAEQIDATKLQVEATNIAGKLTAQQIDATNLKVAAANITGTVTANKMQGNTVELWDTTYPFALGAIELNSAETAVYAMKIKSLFGAIQIIAADGAVHIQNDYGTYIQLKDGDIKLNGNVYIGDKLLTIT